MPQVIRQTKDLAPSLRLISQGISADSRELYDRERVSLGGFYAGSEITGASILIENFRQLRQIHASNILDKTLVEVHKLLTRDMDDVPYYAAVVYAETWIKNLYSQVAREDWLQPNVTVGPEGEVVFEWWQGARKLTIYVSSQSAEYVQVWGLDIYKEMADGNAESIDTCRMLWQWLRDK